MDFWGSDKKAQKKATKPLDSPSQNSYDNPRPSDTRAHSSSGLGRRPLKAEITGSNPVCATIIEKGDASSGF